jgi:hypothetical protein
LEHGLAATAPAWAMAVERSAVGQALRTSLWLFPAVETLHILGLALLVGAIATFDLRVIRAGPGLDLARWERAVLPVARAGFLLAVPMGLLLFTTEATAYARNPAFQLKLLLILAALANIALFHRLRNRAGMLTAGLRLAAALSLALWLAVLACGRLIAYV